MSGDYSRNRTTSSGNRAPVNRKNARPVGQNSNLRYVSPKKSTTPVRKNIKHTKTKPELSHAPERNKFIVFGHDGNIDLTLFTVVMILLIIGLIMMFSASYFWALSEYNDGYYYLKRQGVFAVVGVIAMVLISKIDYHVFQNTKVAYVSFGLLVLINLYTAFGGVNVAGARRWLVIKGLGSFQPSELLKVTFIIVMAYTLSANYPYFKKAVYSVGPGLFFTGVCCGLMMLQRHMSALMIFGVIGVLMMFFGGVNKKHWIRMVAVLAALALCFLAYKMLTSTGEDAGFGYISNRIKAWRHPESDILGSTNQIWNSLIAIGSGGLTGVGIGESKQKFLWLSESQNDFVFAIVCEEMGLVGALLVILLFVMFIIRGVNISTNSPDRFGMLISAGVTLHIGLQAFLNIAVATNTIPNTGISLPFFSYGGTALLVQLCEVGMLLSVSRKTTKD